MVPVAKQTTYLLGNLHCTLILPQNYLLGFFINILGFSFLYKRWTGCRRPAICLIICFVLESLAPYPTKAVQYLAALLWRVAISWREAGVSFTALLGRKNPCINKLKLNLRCSDLWRKGKGNDEEEGKDEGNDDEGEERVERKWWKYLYHSEKNNCKERLAMEILSVYVETEPQYLTAEWWCFFLGRWVLPEVVEAFYQRRSYRDNEITRMQYNNSIWLWSWAAYSLLRKHTERGSSYWRHSYCNFICCLLCP